MKTDVILEGDALAVLKTMDAGSVDCMKKLNVFFIGARQAGCMGLLTLIADGYNIIGVVPYDESVKRIAEEFLINTFKSIKDDVAIERVKKSDIIVSVHGREVVSTKILEMVPLGGINVHPCLYKYKGADPINRMLSDGETHASVGVHFMTDKVDDGPVI